MKINRNTNGVQIKKNQIKVAKSILLPIALKEIPDGSSDTILNEFENELEDWSVPPKKIGSLVTDGTSVLTGKTMALFL